MQYWLLLFSRPWLSDDAPFALYYWIKRNTDCYLFSQVKNKRWIPWVYTWIWHRRKHQVWGLFIHYIYIKHYKNTTYAITFNIYFSCCVPKENTFSPLQVKNKTCDRDKEHVFILGSMDCTVTNKRDYLSKASALTFNKSSSLSTVLHAGTVLNYNTKNFRVFFKLQI